MTGARTSNAVVAPDAGALAAGRPAALSRVSDILVVDDDEGNRAAIEIALGELGRRLVKARSGRDALRLLLDGDFALILLDIQMPGMDGFETARLIRQRERSRHTPIIFVTAFNREDEDILRGYALGAVDFLFKPIVPEVLRAKASVFVELQERTQEVARQGERLRDLERKEAVRKLAAERQRWEAQALREESKRKDEFLALLAHELRNPLAPLVTGLEIFQRGIDEPQLQRVRDAMRRQVSHLVRLVDDLLDISRISRGKIELRRAPVDLAEVVRRAAEDVTPLVEAHHHELQLTIDCEPLPVEGDAVRLVQVVSNLLNNATRYTDNGGCITVSCHREGEQACIEVVDNGRGIAPEMLERIFAMFVQERTGGKGLGLGLTLVQQLVQLHGGAVSAHSEGVGRGSRFVVRLPLCEAPVAATVDASEPPLPPAGQRVALVEDDEDIRTAMVSLLEMWDQDVRCARDGREGVDLIRSWKPDIALVDIGMPVLDGYGVAREIHAELRGHVPHMIALSGFGRTEDRRRSKQAGFDAHLIKPVDLDVLQRALAREADDQTTSPDGHHAEGEDDDLDEGHHEAQGGEVEDPGRPHERRSEDDSAL